MTNGHLKILENCIALQEIQLLWYNYSGAASIELPSYLKRSKILHLKTYKFDASDGTQLGSLILTPDSKIIVCNRLYLGQSSTPYCKF
jgi:hypothetical protein